MKDAQDLVDPMVEMEVLVVLSHPATKSQLIDAVVTMLSLSLTTLVKRLSMKGLVEPVVTSIKILEEKEEV